MNLYVTYQDTAPSVPSYVYAQADVSCGCKLCRWDRGRYGQVDVLSGHSVHQELLPGVFLPWLENHVR